LLIRLTFCFTEELFILDSKKESFEDKSHDNGHHHHTEDVEAHKENTTPIAAFGSQGETFHNYVPIVHNWNNKITFREKNQMEKKLY